MADRRRVPLRRAVIERAVALYPRNLNGRITAPFEMIALTGWAPAPDHPTPKRPGSATARLADALGTDEVKLDGAPHAPRRS